MIMLVRRFICTRLVRTFEFSNVPEHWRRKSRDGNRTVGTDLLIDESLFLNKDQLTEDFISPIHFKVSKKSHQIKAFDQRGSI